MIKNVFLFNQHLQRTARCSIKLSNAIYYASNQQQLNQLSINSKRTNHLGRTIQPELDLIKIWHGMSVDDLANQTKLKPYTIKEIMKDLKIKDLNNLDCLKLVVKELERKYEVIKDPNSKVEAPETEQDLIKKFMVPLGSKQMLKIPVVTIMGHVDHGKTTLLDSLRNSEIVKNEFGGITQHTGAFTVSLDDKKQRSARKKSLVNSDDFSNLITFLDTPGHAAFSNMRERGTKITDFVILVIAAEDGLMPQTIESINFAKKHNVPIIVALNKIDKLDKLTDKEYNAVMDKISKGLLEHGVDLESEGGDVQLVKISALEKIGFDDLKEAILAQTEALELKCVVDGGVTSTIIESTVDQQKGKLTTILVQSGTLKKRDVLVTENGLNYVRVKAIFDENSQIVNNIKPGFSVQFVGWKTNEFYTPQAGDKLIQVKDDKSAIKIMDKAINLLKNKKAKEDFIKYQESTQEHRTQYREFLNNKRAEKKRWMKMRTEVKKFVKFDPEEVRKKVNVILKADVYGTLETLLELFTDYPEEQGINVNILNYGVGSVTENDLETASIFPNTIIYAFNTTFVDKNLEKSVKDKRQVRQFNVIYHLIDDLKKEIESRLPEVEQHVVIGEATVLQAFLINEKSKKVPVAGSICDKGTLKSDRNVLYKIERDGKLVLKDLKISSMRHLKDEVTEIKEKTECGLMFKHYTDVFQPGDKIICYKKQFVKPKTEWTPDGF